MRLAENIAAIWRVFARDVRRVLHSPVALVVVAGACLMPSLYAWYCVAANWDPYQNTASIEVAVANLDEGAESSVAGHLEVGDQVVAKLRDNHQLGWQFTDKDQALRGVESGEYYAALIIPRTFSADFASAFSGDPTQPVIDYYVNEKLSAVAPKVTDAGATTLEEEIDHAFVTAVSEAVVEKAQKEGTTVEERADAATTGLAGDLARARTALDGTRAALDGVSPAADAARQAVADARATIDALDGELPALADDLAQAQSQLDEARAAAQAYGTRLTSGMASGAAALGQASLAADGAIGQATADLQQAQALTDTALSDARQLLDENGALITALEPEAAGRPALSDALARLRDENARLQQTVGSLESQSAVLASAAERAGQAADAADQALGQAADQLGAASRSLGDSVLPDVGRSLDSLSQALGTLRGVAVALQPELARASAVLESLGQALDQAEAAARDAGASLTAAEGRLDDTLADLEALRSSASAGELAQLLGLDPQDVGSFLAAPVSLKTVDVYPVRNYGSGVAPFYTNLALWVAGFILMALLRIRVDPEGLPPLTITQGYLGRWLLFVTLGLAQGLIVTVGDLVLGIQCDQPALFVLAGLVTVFVDVNIMFALAYAFRHIGKAVAVILLIVQIPGSSGMFPVEMMPPFFQALNPLLPFTYSIDAMREAIGGLYGADYWIDLGRLLLFVPPSLLIGLVLGRYAFNLNLLFDDKLGQTGLLASEDAADGARRERFRLRPLLRAVLENATYRAELAGRAERFRRSYPRLIRIGWVLVFAQPLATFLVMVAAHADLETKIVLIAAMVTGLIAVDGYLVAVEYVNARLASQLRLSSLGPDGIARAAQASLPQAPKAAEDEGEGRRRALSPTLAGAAGATSPAHGAETQGAPITPEAGGAHGAPDGAAAPSPADDGATPSRGEARS